MITSCGDNLYNKILDKLYWIKGYPDKKGNLISSNEVNKFFWFILPLLSKSSSKFNNLGVFIPILIVFLGLSIKYVFFFCRTGESLKLVFLTFSDFLKSLILLILLSLFVLAFNIGDTILLLLSSFFYHLNH